MKRTWSLMLTLVVLFCSLPGHAQDVQQILKKIGQLYSPENSVEYNLSYSYYQDIGSLKPFQTQQAAVRFSKKQFMISSVTSQTIINQKYMILVDHTRKVVMIDHKSPTGKKEKKPAKVDYSIDKLLELYKSVSVTSQPGGYYQLNLEMKPGSYNKISRALIRVKSSNYQVEQVILYFDEVQEEDGAHKTKPWMSITYSNTKFNVEFDENTFSGKDILTIDEKGRVKLSETYSSYGLISHL